MNSVSAYVAYLVSNKNINGGDQVERSKLKFKWPD